MGTMMIPAQATLVPLFMIMMRIHLLNTYGAIILPALGQVWGVFLLRQYLQTLSIDYFDAARMDGASEWTVFWRVVIPLSTPALGALGLLTFVATWNDFVWPLIALNSTSLFTLPVGLSTLQQQYYTNYGYILAGGAIAAIPTIIIFLLGQRFFVRGLTTGGIKG
jgi:multiple sugar transport system permease protein